MASHHAVKRILNSLLCHSEDVVHQAIAVIGDWGIGKTYLWRDFYNSHKSTLSYKKYAYVSLFGVNSLDELKLKIATEIISTKTEEDNLLQQDIMPSLKKLGSLLSSARVSDSGVSVGISSSVVSSLMISGLDRTLVCLDDMERRGNKLSIDEVMGLVNYLTQEKDCSVVCLLNRDEIQGANYDNYKEKVFTHELSIDESLDVILKKFADNNNHIIEQFYSIFGVKNIRFYESAFDIYQLFIGCLNKEKLSDTSKCEILSSFLLLKAFDMMPNIMGFGLAKLVNDYSEENYVKQYILGANKDTPEYDSIERKVNEKIQKFMRFFKIDQWQKAILDFIDVYEINRDMSAIVDKDLFSETSLANQRELDEICDEFYDLRLKRDFPNRLQTALINNLATENYSNISFWCNLLEGMGEKSKSEQIIFKTKERIDREIAALTRTDGYLRDAYPFRKQDNDKFHDYITSQLNTIPKPTREQMAEFFIDLYQNNNQKISENFLDHINKQDLETIIWVNLSQLDFGNRKGFLKSIITCSLVNESTQEKYRHWIVELLQEKAALVSSEEAFVIRDYLKHTENLTKSD